VLVKSEKGVFSIPENMETLLLKYGVDYICSSGVNFKLI